MTDERTYDTTDYGAVNDSCTDPENCKRCKTMPAHRGDMVHAGIPLNGCIANAALLAALDLEDEALVAKVRAEIIKLVWPDNFSAETCARAAIAALRNCIAKVIP